MPGDLSNTVRVVAVTIAIAAGSLRVSADDYDECGKDDSPDAVAASRRVAGQGLDFAQAFLAARYEFGKRVPQDYEKAAQWFRKAADQGLAGAQREVVTSIQ
jgi:TPR repeat protein